MISFRLALRSFLTVVFSLQAAFVAAGPSPDPLADTLERARLAALESRSAEGFAAGGASRDELRRELLRLHPLLAQLPPAERAERRAKLRIVERALLQGAGAPDRPVDRVIVGATSCERATTMEQGTTALVAPPGDYGERWSAWLRLPRSLRDDATGSFVSTIDTLGSSSDTVLELHAVCGGDVVRRDDDGAGVLQSRLELGQDLDAGALLVRVESAIGQKTLVTLGGGDSVIRGTVTSADGGPIDVRVNLTDELGFLVASELGSGQYTFNGLLPARYYVFTATFSASGWLDEIYDDVQCGRICEPLRGQPLDLPPSSELEASFELARGGVLSGRVVDQADGEPIVDAEVTLVTPAGVGIEGVSTDSAGRYRFSGLRGGAYYVVATDFLYLDELYDDVECESFNCSYAEGDLVTVVEGETTSGIDFALEARASISGRIVEELSGTPLEYCVTAENVDTSIAWFACTDPDGFYTVGGLPAGSYRVYTGGASHRDELYDDIPCDGGGCDFGAATLVSVADGDGASGIDFALRPNGSLGGRMTDAATGEPVNVHAVRVGEPPSIGFHVLPSSDGSWSTGPLPPGTYAAASESVFGVGPYREQLFDRIPCGGSCDLGDGTPISLALGVDLDGIDFPLERSSRIIGRITDESGVPLPNVPIDLYDDQGALVRTRGTDATGSYSIFVDSPGTYFLVIADVFRGPFIPEVYDDRPCVGGCDPTTGTPVVLGAEETVEADVVLRRRGRITGRVVSALDGSPIVGETIRIHLANGTFVDAVETNGSGDYDLTGYPEGNYRLVATADDFLDEVWNDRPCTMGGCDAASGDPVPIVDGTVTKADFALSTGATIRGTVASTDAARAVDGFVRLLDGTGATLRSARIQSDGSYVFGGLAAGTYYLGVDSPTHQGEVWDDVPCDDGAYPGCIGAASGVPVIGNQTAERSFVLEPYGVIRGSVSDSRTGDGIQFASVFVFGAVSQTLVDIVNTDVDGTYEVQLRSGDYKIHVVSLDYIDELYDDVQCEGGCSLGLGQALSASIGSVVVADVELDPGPGLLVRVLEAGSGGPLRGVPVDIWLPDGTHWTVATTDAQGRAYFTNDFFSGFVSTDTSLRYINEIYDDIQCPGGSAFDGTCDPTTGDLVVTNVQNNVEITIELESLDGLFADGFESGDTSSWDDMSP